MAGNRRALRDGREGRARAIRGPTSDPPRARVESAAMLEIYSFDLLPYRSLTAFPGWPFPNSLFDPGRGAVDYAEHIEEAVLCEELGFDGVIFNEHHCSAYGLMPSPKLVAATLAARTTRMKIGVL